MPQPATGARGEGIIVLPDGEQVRVLFTNRALVEAERALGKSILALAQGFGDGIVGIGDVAQLLLVGMQASRRDERAGGPIPNLASAYDVMDQVGFAKVAEAVIGAVAGVLSYGQDDAGGEDPDPNA